MKKLWICTFVIMIILAGCGTDSTEPEQIGQVNEHGDVHEMTASMNLMPTFLEHYQESIASIYEQVPHYQELIEHMPCYCGCGESVGHGSAYDCFIHDQGSDGSVVWDDHGAKCNVCLEIAYYSIELYDEGVSPAEIRQVIDQTYEKGYAKPTNTPFPEGV